MQLGSGSPFKPNTPQGGISAPIQNQPSESKMIISASRRTDIPAFYSQWFVNRLREGYVLVRNPMNFGQVSRITLSPETTECIVFWTKNPKEMLAKLPEIDSLGYRYYFLFTLTPYDQSIEPNVPGQEESIETFRTLADMVGQEKVIWRYDPILFTGRYSEQFHCEAFAQLAGKLSGFTDRCIISFLQMYRKCQRNMKCIGLLDTTTDTRMALVRTLHGLGATQEISVQACAPGTNQEQSGIPPGKCIDDRLISPIIGAKVTARKDNNQRKECGCIESIDIGAYNSCPHHCLYCYANSDRASVTKNFAAHASDSPLLYSILREEDRITDRLLKSIIKRQLSLF
jgi:hypothetical protein